MKVITKSPVSTTPIQEATDNGIPPTPTVGETYASEKPSLLEDYAQLFKYRVMMMVVLCAWAGYFFAARRSGIPYFSKQLFFTLLGIALTKCGAAAINEAMEVESDGRMMRTRNRPLPAGRMHLPEAIAAAVLTTFAGTAVLMTQTNILTGLLALSTVLFYAFVYTPLKKITTWATFLGAIPGAMPPLLGWTAVRGAVEWETLALFAIMFFWQFPHFHAIAWLYREDYERAHIKMLPVVDRSGRRTLFQILGYGVMLIPVSLAPFYMHMAGAYYAVGSVILGIGYLAFGIRLAMLKLPPMAAHSKKSARELLRASVIYLPLLLLLLALNGAH